MIQIEVSVLVCEWGGTNRWASHGTVGVLRDTTSGSRDVRLLYSHYFSLRL